MAIITGKKLITSVQFNFGSQLHLESLAEAVQHSIDTISTRSDHRVPWNPIQDTCRHYLQLICVQQPPVPTYQILRPASANNNYELRHCHKFQYHPKSL